MSRAFHLALAGTALLASSLGAQSSPSPQTSGVRGLPTAGRSNTLLAASNGDVRLFRVNADETRIVYLADRERDELPELYAVKPEGGPSLKLSAPFGAGRVGVLDFRLSPNGKRVLYLADHERARRYELYSVSIHGGPVVKISRPNLSASLVPDSYVIDDKRVVFLDHDGGVRGVFVAPLDGGPFVKVSSSGGAVLLQGFRLTPDGERLVFDEVSSGIHTLFSTPLDGSGPTVLLNQGVIANPFPQLFEFSPDSTRVVFQQGSSALGSLHSVPVDGSALPVQLSSQSPHTWAVTPDGARVVFQANGLFTVPIDGSAAPLELNQGLVFRYALSSSGQVAFVSSPSSGPLELFSTESSGGTPAVPLSDPGENLSIQVGPAYWGPLLDLGPDGSRALFAASHAPNQAALFTVPIAGASAPTELAALPANSWIPIRWDGTAFLEIDPLSQRVAYLASTIFTATPAASLFSVPLDGTSSPVELNAGAAGALVQQFALGPKAGRLFFAADHLEQDVIELFSVPLDGSQHPLQLVDL